MAAAAQGSSGRAVPLRLQGKARPGQVRRRLRGHSACFPGMPRNCINMIVQASTGLVECSAIDSRCYGRSKPVRPSDDDWMTGRLGNTRLAAGRRSRRTLSAATKGRDTWTHLGLSGVASDGAAGQALAICDSASSGWPARARLAPRLPSCPAVCDYSATARSPSQSSSVRTRA